MELSGRVALVTGAGSGIGRASALGLAAAGAAVAALDVRLDTAAETVAAIEQAGGRGLALQADVTRRGAVEEAVARAEFTLGGVDVLMSCAGGSLVSNFLELDEDEWDRVVDLNLKGPYLCAHAVAPGMVARRRGRIINVSSNYGVTGSAPRVHYSAAKAGIIGFTKALALELGPYGITVNAVAPGPTATERVRGKYSAEAWAERAAGIPLGRTGEPEDIADAVVFLASDRARYITGQTLHVNGGLVMP